MDKQKDKEIVKKDKKLTAKTKRILIVSACLVVVVLAVALPIGLIFGKKVTVPTPYFLPFNEAEDDYIHVRWNKIRDAVNYDYIFYYGNPQEAVNKDLTINSTQNTTTSIQRHKGTVAFKVKANIIGEKTEYSDWITIDVPARKLSSPEVTITNDLDISWTPVTFEIDKVLYEVKNYEYEIVVDGKTAIPNGKIAATRLGAKDYLKNYLENYVDRIAENILSGEWVDVPVTVNVKAVTYVTFGDVELKNPTDKQDALLPKIFDAGDFGSKTLWITKEIFMSL